MINFLELHARQKIGQSADWKTFRYAVHDCPVGDYYEVAGAVTPLKKSGPNKGYPNWQKRDRATERTVHFSVEEHKAFLAQWEVETGLCAECSGKGQQWMGWSEATGHRYKVCPRCNGTGRLDGQAQPQPAIDQLEMAI